MIDFSGISRIEKGRSGRVSSWDSSGRNDDKWRIPAGESRLLADIEGPGRITHIWMTQRRHYRECLLKITWDDAAQPSVLVPLGDFFCLGHAMVNSFQSLFFSASTNFNNSFESGCALNCYLPMPFKKRARIELLNESDQEHTQYFYIDYERYDSPLPDDEGLLHAEFRRTYPFGGWGPEILVNHPEADVVNRERDAWENNYVILETRGRGHYIGCNLSVTNFQGTWWGEGDDMIWVDGYKWPPDIHGTGSEDYLNQAWGMQDNAFLRNGSSIYEYNTIPHTKPNVPRTPAGGYQTSYVFHVENPVRFQQEIKVSIEHGHGNHLTNEMSSVAYWYADEPSAAADPPPAAQRLPVLRDNRGEWIRNPSREVPGKQVPLNDEMKEMKTRWKENG